jgi:jouberin
LCTLHHPSFVYVARYHPASSKTPIILTGSFDRKIRVWNRETGNIITELEGHAGRVNSLVFTPDNTKLYSADSTGIIKMWSCRLSKESSEAVIRDSFILLLTIENDVILKSSLSSISVDPNYPQERIIVHSQDNMIRRIETFRKIVKNNYSRVKNSMNAQKCCVSPCGTYLVSGSDCGRVYFWEIETSKLVYTEGKNYHFKENPVYQIAWSPKEHIIALCSFGESEPIRIFAHKKDSNEENPDYLNDIESSHLLDTLSPDRKIS